MFYGNPDVNSIYKANLTYVGGLEAVDDNTVVFTLSQPVDYFEYYLTFPIMSANNYEGTSMLDGERNAAPIGTGMLLLQILMEMSIILIKIQIIGIRVKIL